MPPATEASITLLFAVLVFATVTVHAEAYANEANGETKSPKDPHRVSDACFNACCRVKGVANDLLPYCNYTALIEAFEFLDAKQFQSNLTQAEKEKLKQFNDVNKSLKGEDAQKFAFCLYPEGVSGMEQCCAEAGLSYTCTSCDYDYFRAKANGPEEFGAMREKCGFQGGFRLSDGLVAFKCLREGGGLLATGILNAEK